MQRNGKYDPYMVGGGAVRVNRTCLWESPNTGLTKQRYQISYFICGQRTLKKIMSKELKESIRTMSHTIDKVIKNYLKKNQIELQDLKRVINEIKSNTLGGSTADLNYQKKESPNFEKGQLKLVWGTGKRKDHHSTIKQLSSSKKKFF